MALAAQKTLENVIAGPLSIFDQAVTTGDFLKMGEISGTVDHIGLRSTRIRTLDRTIVSVPNSQIASAAPRNALGARQVPVPPRRRSPLRDDARAASSRRRWDPCSARREPLADEDSVRVRFLRLGASSLDVDVFAYLRAAGFNHFLELQESLLFGITEIVARAGTEIAFPSQTMYVDSQEPRTETRSQVATKRGWTGLTRVNRWDRSREADDCSRSIFVRLLRALVVAAAGPRFEAAAEREMEVDALHPLFGLDADERRARRIEGELPLVDEAKIGAADLELRLHDIEGALAVGERLPRGFARGRARRAPPTARFRLR